MKKKGLFLGMFSMVLALGMVVVGCASAPMPQLDYSKIIDVSGSSKDDLFVRTNLWAVSYFNKADSVIEFSDKESGTISGKYIGAETSYMGGLSGRSVVKSTFVISMKDGKVKVDLEPAELIVYNGNGLRVSSGGLSINKENLVKDYDATVESLTQALTKNSNW